MSLRNLILRNFWLKAFSIILATVIWFFIHDGIRHDAALNELTNRPLPQEYIRVPVTIQTRPGDSRVFRATPSAVIIIAEGEETALRRAARQDIRACVNVTDFNYKEPVTEELRADVPTNINVLEISPPVVKVQQVSP
jgi:hypothetical protein